MSVVLSKRFGGVMLMFGARYTISEAVPGEIIGRLVNHRLYGLMIGASFFGRHVATWAR